jgi:enoyl-CoA hydratase/carnithine racemase
MNCDTILYAEDGPARSLTLNRPEDGNMFTPIMCYEIRDCINLVRRETRARVLVVTGVGNHFSCIGRNAGAEDILLNPGVLLTLDMYESIERLQKPVIAPVTAARSAAAMCCRLCAISRQGECRLPPGRADDRSRLHRTPQTRSRQIRALNCLATSLRKSSP